MAKWSKRDIQMNENHTWRCKPGNRILVLDRGALSFELPRTWVVSPGDNSVKAHDREPPDDDAVLEVTVTNLPIGPDWEALDLAELLGKTMGELQAHDVSRTDVYFERRRRFDLAWLETTYHDPISGDLAKQRNALVRYGWVQALFTLIYWPRDGRRVLKMWNSALETMRLGEIILDPAKGPNRRDEGRLH